MADIDDLMSAGFDLLDELVKIKEDDERVAKIKEHIEVAETKFKVNVPQFDNGLEWLNVARSLSLQDDLRGKVVVLDFFTYCCINCMNVLPDLEAIEEKYSTADGVAIIGVHSAKFTNEKVTENIRNAIIKYNIRHPVVNDSDCALWNALNVVCWPTFVVVSPTGKALLTVLGEGHRKLLTEFLGVCIEHFNALRLLSPHKLPLKLETKDRKVASVLNFPGKITKDSGHDTFVLSDSGNNRILVFDSEGCVKHVIGGKERGFKDGTYSEAQFNAPQGVAINQGVVYVADTGNHSIRRIILAEEIVDTVVGTGVQGHDYAGGKAGSKQLLSSPWDVTLGSSDGSVEYDILYIAMAGTHQIWALFLRDATWYGPWKVRKGTCFQIVGSGVEQNKNHRDPKRACLAQPSGLVLSQQMGHMYFADSESSSVRRVFLKDGSVTALIGGEPRPQHMSESLFAYGDTEGMGLKAKLQHPMGVELLDPADGPLLIADTYNHKIKKVDLKTRECTTWIGSERGNKVSDTLTEVQLNEPNDLHVDGQGKKLYIVDTNNHDIKVVGLGEEATCTSLKLKMPDKVDAPKPVAKPQEVFKRLIANVKNVTKLGAVTVKPGAILTFDVSVVWKAGLHVTEGVDSAWQVFSVDKELSKATQTEPVGKGVFTPKASTGKCSVTLPATFKPHTEALFTAEMMLFYCDDAGVCKTKQEVYSVGVKVAPGAGVGAKTITIQCKPT